MKLPLELVSVVTEIRKELDLFGFGCIVIQGVKVDYKRSVFEVLNHINAVFANLELPFGYIFESACTYVLEIQAYCEKTLNKS